MNARFQFGDFELDAQRGVLLQAGTLLKLQPQPFRVLEYLLSRAPEIVSREELGEFVWGERGVHVELDQSLSYCIRQIRQTLGDSATEPMYIETLPRQGYRFIGAIQSNAPLQPTAAPVGGTAADAEEQSVADLEGRPRRAWWSLPYLRPAVALSVLVVAAALWIGHLSSRADGRSPIHAIAVLPLLNASGDREQDYFADGMTDELITELARVPGLQVISRTSIMQSRWTNMPLRQLSKDLHVDAIVEGSVVRAGDQVRITARLVDARTDANLWGETFEGRATDVLSLQDGVAREIVANARVAALPSDGGRKSRSVNPVAYDAYLRGLYFYNKRDARRSAVYFQKAIDADPRYAGGYVGMADALESEYTLALEPLGVAIPKGIAFGRQAILLDPSNGDAYTVLGSLQTLAWDMPSAEANLKRGLQLSPGSSMAEMKYAIYLDVTAHPEEAIVHMRRALQLDPLSFLMNRHLGSTLYFGRHYDEALVYLARAKEMEPALPALVDNWMSFVYEKQGHQPEAVEHDLAALHGSSPAIDTAALRQVYRSKGWKAYWQARVHAAELHPSACPAYPEALNAMRQGDRDMALQQLTMAVDRHCFWMMWSPVDPLLDDLRDDARFAALVQRIQKPDSQKQAGMP